MQLAPALVTEPCGSQAFSVRFSPDGAFLAASGAQGKVCVFNVSTGQEAYRLNRNETHPVKQVCWRPESDGASLRTRGILVGASTDGKLRQWHTTSARLLHEFGNPEEIGQLFCVDYSPDGSCLVAGGLQELWVFDEETKQMRSKLTGGDSTTTAGHCSRVQAVRFPRTLGEPNVVLSGGWDNTVQFWDLRAGHAVRLIHGPHLCGDALDTHPGGKLLLTGSWREEDPLELWDVGSGRRVQTVPWRPAGSAQDPRCLLFSARFSREAGALTIAAGGAFAGPGGGEAKVLVLGAGGSEDAPEAGAGPCHCAGTLVRFTCLSVDFSPGASSRMVAFAGSDGRARVMRLLAPGEAAELPAGRASAAKGAGYPAGA